MDALDILILREMSHKKASVREMAEHAGVTPNTIHNRLKKLENSGILKIAGMIDPQRLPGHQSAILGFKTDSKKIAVIMSQLRELPGVSYVAHVRGSLDILAVVIFNEERTYRKFVDKELSHITEPLFMETFFIENTGELRTGYRG